MAQKTKTIIKETEVDSEELQSRAVHAYRLGQLEKVVADGFKDVKEEITNLSHNFATKSDVEAAKREATKEHKRIDDDIKDVNARVAKVENWLTWVGRIVLGAVIAAVIGLVIVRPGVQ